MSRKIPCILLLLPLSLPVVLVETKTHSGRKHHNRHEKTKNRVFEFDSSRNEDEMHKKEDSTHVAHHGRGVKHRFKRINGCYPFKLNTKLTTAISNMWLDTTSPNKWPTTTTTNTGQQATPPKTKPRATALLTSKINSHHKQRHQTADKHRTVHVPSRHHTREATNEEDNVPLTDSLHTTNEIMINPTIQRTRQKAMNRDDCR